MWVLSFDSPLLPAINPESMVIDEQTAKQILKIQNQ